MTHNPTNDEEEAMSRDLIGPIRGQAEDEKCGTGDTAPNIVRRWFTQEELCDLCQGSLIADPCVTCPTAAPFLPSNLSNRKVH